MTESYKDVDGLAAGSNYVQKQRIYLDISLEISQDQIKHGKRRENLETGCQLGQLYIQLYIRKLMKLCGSLTPH